MSNNSIYLSNKVINHFEHIIEYPLTIVEAPMGYGKTTATQFWLKHNNYDYNWCRITEETIEMFGDQLNSLFMRIFDRDDKYCETLIYKETQEYTRKVLELINYENLSDINILVIDDFHVLRNEFISNLIECIVNQEIDNFHIVFTVRNISIRNFEELRLKGLIHHINKENLEFSEVDIIKYFKLCGLTISNDDGKTLFQNTEGWISAIYMLMLEYQVNGEFAPSMSIYKLLEKSIYQSLSTEVKELLNHVCFFDSFTLEQARYIYGKPNVFNMLNNLIDNNMFITYDAIAKVYAIHSIFRGYIVDRFNDKATSVKESIYRKAGKWFVEQERYYIARKYFYMYKDYESILNTIAIDDTNSYTISNKLSIDKYMSECPEDIKAKHYYAMLNYGLRQLVNNELEAMFTTCETVRHNILNDVNLSQSDQNILLGELELLMSLTELNDLDKMYQRFKKSWELMGRKTKMFFAKNNFSFGSPSIICMFYRYTTTLKSTIDKLAEVMPYYERLTNNHGAGAEEAALAEYEYQLGHLAKAEIHAHKGFIKSKENREDIVYCGLYNKFKIYIMGGHYEKAFHCISEMDEFEDLHRDYHGIYISEMTKGYIYSYLGIIDRIPKLFREDGIEQNRIMFPGKPFYNIILGRQMLLEEAYIELIGTCEYFIGIAEVMPNLLGSIYSYLYLSSAYRRIYDDKLSKDYLTKALDLGLPDKLYMVYVENCEFIEPMLQELLDEGSYVEDLTYILDQYKVYNKHKTKFKELYMDDKRPKLTLRELEIARLASCGNSNGEIAKQLFVSPNTVKKALSSVYHKLSINNRALLKDVLIDYN